MFKVCYFYKLFHSYGLIEEDVSLDNFTMTSDGQGSLPYFDENNHFLGLGVGSAKALLVGIKEAVQKESIPLEIALRAITSNPARILKLEKRKNRNWC
ncbi:hypothetical protein EfmAA96_23440 [Enterococcus faecium]|nr:hypothetical protein EfmAA96_23440 [Enterococcus faecium]